MIKISKAAYLSICQNMLYKIIKEEDPIFYFDRFVEYVKGVEEGKELEDPMVEYEKFLETYQLNPLETLLAKSFTKGDFDAVVEKISEQYGKESDQYTYFINLENDLDGNYNQLVDRVFDRRFQDVRANLDEYGLIFLQSLAHLYGFELIDDANGGYVIHQ